MKSIIKILLLAGLACAIPAALHAADAQEHWTKDCKKCHGADGSGQTPMGKKLKLKSYADPAVQAEMTDEDIIKAIKEGTKDETTGKETMKAYANVYTADEIAALVALIRSLATPAP
jgi:cytochrome c553